MTPFPYAGMSVAGAQPRTRLIIALHLLVSSGSVTAAFLVASAFDSPTSVRLVCIIMSCVGAWLIWSWRGAAGGFFNPYGLFLVAALLFNAGQALLEVFAWNGDGLLGGVFPPSVLNETLILVLVSFTTLHLGALVALVATTATRGRLAAKTRGNDLTNARALRIVGSLLLAVSIIPMAMVIKDALDVVSLTGYAGLYDRDFLTGLQAGPQVLAALMVPGALFLLAGSRTGAPAVMISGVIIAAYAVVMLSIGYRAWAIMPIVAWAWLYQRTIRTINPWLLIFGAGLLIGIVFPLVRAVRDVALADRTYFDYLGSFLSTSNPILSTLSEMGGSMATVAYTVTLVPDSHPFDFGVGYAYSALTAMPNLFWPLHPSIAHGTYSNWLTQTVAPAYVRNGGLGFSFIAEAFANFGWLGPLAIGLLGFGFTKLYLWADRTAEPARLAAVASYFSFILLFARGESNLLVRPLLWYSLLPYAAVLLIARWARAGRAHGMTIANSAVAR